MRPDGRAEQVVRAERDRRPSRAGPRRSRRAASGRRRSPARLPHRAASCARRSAPGAPVDGAHVDDAWQAEARASCRAGDAVLAGAGLGDDALRAEPLRQQRLADRVVDLVRAGVREVLALQPDVGAPAPRQRMRIASAASAGRPRCAARRRSSARKSWIRRQRAHALLEPVERGHERLGYVAPAERAEAAALRRETGRAVRLREQRLAVRFSPSVLIASLLLVTAGNAAHAPPRRRTNSRIRAGSLTPRRALHAARLTSTPNGRTDADRLARHSPASARRPARPARRARGAAPRPVGHLARAALRALEQQRAAAAVRLPRARRARSTGSTGDPGWQHQASRGPQRPSARGPARTRGDRGIDQLPATDAGTRRRLDRRAARRRRARRSAPRRDVARRRGMKHEPDRVCTRARPRPRRLGVAQAADLDPEVSHDGPAQRQRMATRLEQLANGARGIRPPHQRRADERHGDSPSAATRAASSGVRCRSRRRAGHAAAAGRATRRSRSAIDLQRLQVAAVDADQHLFVAPMASRAAVRAPPRGRRRRRPRAARTGRSSAAQSSIADQRLARSMRTMSSTPHAPAARASQTW